MVVPSAVDLYRLQDRGLIDNPTRLQILTALKNGGVPLDGPECHRCSRLDAATDILCDTPSMELLWCCFELAHRGPSNAASHREAFWKAWSACGPANPHEKHGSQVTEEDAEQLRILANCTFGSLMQLLIDKLEEIGEAIGWSFESGAKDGRLFRVERPLAKKSKVLRWYAVHPSGLGGMFTSGLGLIEKCAAKGQALVIDWSNPDLLYGGRESGLNFWEEFWAQPALAILSEDEIQEALTEDDVTTFVGTPCTQTPKVGLPILYATRGRLLCQHFAWFRPEVWQVVCDFAHQNLPEPWNDCTGTLDSVSGIARHRWLALHIRRTDKGDESPENMALTAEDIIYQTKVTCEAWGCIGVFLCSDDWRLKTYISVQLEETGVKVSSYRPLLSPDSNKCAHMNADLEKHRKTWDAIFEVAIMSICEGLLCTHSFMANMAIYYSRPSYRYRSFWDPLPEPLQGFFAWEAVD